MLFPDLHSIPYLTPEFIVQKTTFTWREIHWAYEHQMFGSMMFVKIALLKRESSDLEIELSKIDKDHLWRAQEIVVELIKNEPEIPEEKIMHKWLFWALTYVYENKDQFVDPLEQVEDIYEAFGHPKELDSFIRYMPADLSEYDPREHTEEENKQRLYSSWNHYLEVQKIKYQKIDS